MCVYVCMYVCGPRGNLFESTLRVASIYKYTTRGCGKHSKLRAYQPCCYIATCRGFDVCINLLRKVGPRFMAIDV